MLSFLLVCSIAHLKSSSPATVPAKWTTIHFHEFKGFVEIYVSTNVNCGTLNLASAPNPDAKYGVGQLERFEQRSRGPDAKSATSIECQASSCGFDELMLVIPRSRRRRPCLRSIRYPSAEL